VVWFKVDDGFHSSRKLLSIRRGIRLECAGLWVIAGSWSAHEELDGLVPDYMVEEFGGTQEHIDALLKSGLWESAPEAVQFAKWTEYQPTRADLEAERGKARERMRRVRANNTRTSEGTSEGTQPEVRITRPVPSRPEDLTLTTESRPVVGGSVTTDSELSPAVEALAATAGITRVEAIVDIIRQRTQREVSPEHAVGVARWLLAKARDPKVPQRYVIGAIARSPLEVQKHIDEAGLAS
jgi:hypothetical protein